MARPLSAGIGLGLEAPSEMPVVKQFHVADRNMNERVPIAGLDQDHANGRVFAKTVGQDASGRPGADDHVIRLHLRSLPKAAAALAFPSAVDCQGVIQSSAEAVRQSRRFRGAFWWSRHREGDGNVRFRRDAPRQGPSAELALLPQTGHPARREERVEKPVLKGSTISAFETCHPIDTAPPVGEKMLLPRDRRPGAEGGSKQF
jgi:hypothetical protein